MKKDEIVAINGERREHYCGQFVLFFGILFVVGHGQQHCNGDYDILTPLNV